MKRWTAIVMMCVIPAALLHGAAQQLSDDEQRTLRDRIEQRFDVVPLTGGVALTPKSRMNDVRLIEITDTIAINGVAVSGRELRDRVGGDADSILRLSYLDANARRDLFSNPDPERAAPDAALEPERPPTPESPESTIKRTRRSHGDRVRIFGDVSVAEDEEVSGAVVAVMGSARVDGEVAQDVVSVFGRVDLGPHAVVHGDVVAIGGRLHRAATAHVGRGVTEIALGDAGSHVTFSPWLDGWGPVSFGGFGPVTRLVGSTFRYGLLALLACVALVIARRPVEGSASRVADNPVKATLVGMAAWVLFAPLMLATAFVLAISIVGIPLLLLLPFVVLALAGDGAHRVQRQRLCGGAVDAPAVQDGGRPRGR